MWKSRLAKVTLTLKSPALAFCERDFHCAYHNSKSCYRVYPLKPMEISSAKGEWTINAAPSASSISKPKKSINLPSSCSRYILLKYIRNCHVSISKSLKGLRDLFAQDSSSSFLTSLKSSLLHHRII